MRYNPRLVAEGKNPFTWIPRRRPSRLKSTPITKTLYYARPERRGSRERLLKLAQQDVQTRWKLYEQFASMSFNGGGEKKAT